VSEGLGPPGTELPAGRIVTAIPGPLKFDVPPPSAYSDGSTGGTHETTAANAIAPAAASAAIIRLFLGITISLLNKKPMSNISAA
jgi:hypothetical protein